MISEKTTENMNNTQLEYVDEDLLIIENNNNININNNNSNKPSKIITKRDYLKELFQQPKEGNHQGAIINDIEIDLSDSDYDDIIYSDNKLPSHMDAIVQVGCAYSKMKSIGTQTDVYCKISIDAETQCNFEGDQKNIESNPLDFNNLPQPQTIPEDISESRENTTTNINVPENNVSYKYSNFLRLNDFKILRDVIYILSAYENFQHILLSVKNSTANTNLKNALTKLISWFKQIDFTTEFENLFNEIDVPMVLLSNYQDLSDENQTFVIQKLIKDFLNTLKSHNYKRVLAIKTNLSLIKPAINGFSFCDIFQSGKRDTNKLNNTVQFRQCQYSDGLQNNNNQPQNISSPNNIQSGTFTINPPTTLLHQQGLTQTCTTTSPLVTQNNHYSSYFENSSCNQPCVVNQAPVANQQSSKIVENPLLLQLLCNSQSNIQQRQTEKSHTNISNDLTNNTTNRTLHYGQNHSLNNSQNQQYYNYQQYGSTQNPASSAQQNQLNAEYYGNTLNYQQRQTTNQYKKPPPNYAQSRINRIGPYRATNIYLNPSVNLSQQLPVTSFTGIRSNHSQAFPNNSTNYTQNYASDTSLLTNTANFSPNQSNDIVPVISPTDSQYQINYAANSLRSPQNQIINSSNSLSQYYTNNSSSVGNSINYNQIQSNGTFIDNLSNYSQNQNNFTSNSMMNVTNSYENMTQHNVTENTVISHTNKNSSTEFNNNNHQQQQQQQQQQQTVSYLAAPTVNTSQLQLDSSEVCNIFGI